MLRENSGLFARTAKAIREQFNIDYSRQAVRDRALKHPEELADIKEENKDIAEEGLFTLMQSKNEMVKLRAIDLFLKTQAKDRGYIEKSQLDLTVPQGVKVIYE